MDVKLCSLSGESVVTLQVLPSETVADIKEELDKSNDSPSIDDVTLVLDGVPLEDNQRLDELPIHSNSQWHVVRSRKSAREILFSSREEAFRLAEHYDSLQDQCQAEIGTLFLDEEGNARSLRATIEVLIALRQKLFEPACGPGLLAFKAALTDVALEALVCTEGRHRDGLIACFPCFGLEAVQALLAETVDFDWKYGVGLRYQGILKLQFAKLPKAMLLELRHELPPTSNSSSPAQAQAASQLTAILEQTLVSAKLKSKAQGKRKKASPTYIPLIEAPPPFETVGALLTTLRRRHYSLHSAGEEVELRTGSMPTHKTAPKAMRSLVLAAIKQEPECVLPHVDWRLALAAVQSHPGTYNLLPDCFKKDRDILYAALACDPTLQAEFLNTAGKGEISQWQWQAGEGTKKRR